MSCLSEHWWWWPAVTSCPLFDWWIPLHRQRWIPADLEVLSVHHGWCSVNGETMSIKKTNYKKWDREKRRRLAVSSNKTRWLDRQIYNFILRHGLEGEVEGRWVMIKQLTAHDGQCWENEIGPAPRSSQSCYVTETHNKWTWIIGWKYFVCIVVKGKEYFQTKKLTW